MMDKKTALYCKESGQIILCDNLFCITAIKKGP
jgi:hypothetical protein